ncbi:MAG: thiamine pyrophosphate-binding protein [Acutalibacteraceae bacterium]
MKVSDYIVSFLAKNNINHVFGYQGTMIAHFVDSVCKSQTVKNHMCYNEQGAAFAAVGYAKASGQTALAYATSGPGAINLLSGIADAYYDSAPVVFITGQVNTNEYTGIDVLRQQAFQQTDVISIVKPVTKYAVQITEKDDVRYEFEKAFHIASSGRKGPVVIDLPMNIQRMDIDPDNISTFTPEERTDEKKEASDAAEEIKNLLLSAEKPILLVGNGIVKGTEAHKKLKKLIDLLNIPVITSIFGKQLLDDDDIHNMGFVGAAYGHRCANIIADCKTDLIVSLACSVCKRQTGIRSISFAQNAKIVRVDIDKNELIRKVHDDDISFNLDVSGVIDALIELFENENYDRNNWLSKCTEIKKMLSDFDDTCADREPNKYITAISELCESDDVVCSDVGQHQMWTAQSFKIKENIRLLFSGGHGAMGFALPAAIGAHYFTGKRTVAICGDGAFQMNIQELQWVAREQLPIIIYVLNNRSLGLIRQQQDDFFDNNHFGSTAQYGYDTPDFEAVAKAYKINAATVGSIAQMKEAVASADKTKPFLLQVNIDENSKASPKTYFGEKMHNQKPYITPELADFIEKI